MHQGRSCSCRRWGKVWLTSKGLKLCKPAACMCPSYRSIIEHFLHKGVHMGQWCYAWINMHSGCYIHLPYAKVEVNIKLYACVKIHSTLWRTSNCWKWLTSATNHSFSVLHACGLLTTPTPLAWHCADATAHARAQRSSSPVLHVLPVNVAGGIVCNMLYVCMYVSVA